MLGVVPSRPVGLYVVVLDNSQPLAANTGISVRHSIVRIVIGQAPCARQVSARFRVQFRWPQRSSMQLGSLICVLNTFLWIFAS
jgi:hypothetical protein